jgi:membrane protein YqaA with SNARE-associated domain
MIRKCYEWCLGWAKSPYAGAALFIFAFCEAVFFPIPPDILLIALCLGVPFKSFKYAFICLVGSLFGGALGYFIGMEFMNQIGDKILTLYNLSDEFNYIELLYKKYDAWAVGIAGFTPFPYKVITLSSGAFKIDFAVFFIASFISRGLRFFLIGGLIFFFGASIKSFIDKYFNILAIVFTILLILGFILIKIIL